MPLKEEQIAALGRKLRQARIKTRQQGGIELRYIEGWYAISEANRIFGYDGWSRETISLNNILVKTAEGKFSVSYIARVKIVVAAGTGSIVREGTGVGHSVSELLGHAHEIAAKSAETDATKRALATFGSRFGLELAAGSLTPKGSEVIQIEKSNSTGHVRLVQSAKRDSSDS